MGRVEGASEERLMTAGEVASHLLNSCGSLREFESFMFGSALFGVGSDYDLLIVGPPGEPLSRLKAEIELAGEELPLDVLYMLPTEAEETEFVLNEGCITLSQLANSN
ncbi:nucleotidyltransferase domain-containing protein [Sinorhizobium meliloti]|uniref:nucleotidyltransferase domain-containing protein n=1 Tax=Rhizobium meliloti TaxID=382 RepID=UPI0030D24EBC